MEGLRCSGIMEPPIVALKRRLFPGGSVPGDILDLNQAVPSWPPPEVVLRAAAEAGGSPAGARYTEDAGLGELRAAVARHLAGRHGARIEPEQVLICAGANMGFSILAQALCSTERRAHLVTPYYFNHPMAVQLAGGAVCERRLPAGLSLAEAVEGGLLEARAGEMILLVNPSNPSGRTHSREDVGALLEHARTSGAFLVLDETYLEFFPRDEEPVTLASLPGWSEHGAVVGTFSKSLAITGHRVGYLACSAALLEELLKVQDTLVICAPHPGQRAALAGLAWEGLAGWQAGRRAEMDGRVRAFREALEVQDAGLEVESSGAFFAYLRHPFEGSSWDVARQLVREERVFVLPGACCGAGEEGCLRVAVGNADEAALRIAAERMGRLARGV